MFPAAAHMAMWEVLMEGVWRCTEEAKKRRQS
jgi:hypothetical protein